MGYMTFNLRVTSSTVYPQSALDRYAGLPIRCLITAPEENIEIGSIYMQAQTASTLAALMPNEGDTATLGDKRDDKAYSVAKLVGKYWMTDNLDIAGLTVLTPQLSNVAKKYLLVKSETSFGYFPPEEYLYKSGSWYCSSGNSPCHSYYSYATATAGRNPASGDSEYDICPKGWRLPTFAEYSALQNAYSDLVNSPFLGANAGYYSSSGFSRGGGYYWTSTAYNTDETYYLYHDYPINVNGRSTVKKGYGLPVRCVANV